MENSKKTLHLTLSKLPFDVMVTGEKTEEFRKNSQWIRSRLIGKDYDFVKFTNGYGKDKPYFICQYKDYIQCYMTFHRRKYSNGLVVEGIGRGDFIIYLGKIIETGNIK